MSMIKWVQPSGRVISTNQTEASIAAAEALGWKLKLPKAPPKPQTDEEAKDSVKRRIEACDTKDQILDILKTLDIEIESKGALSTFKKKALKAVG